MSSARKGRARARGVGILLLALFSSGCGSPPPSEPAGPAGTATGAAPTTALPQPVEGRWFQRPVRFDTWLLADGSVTFLLGGRRAQHSSSGGLELSKDDPPDLRQLTLVPTSTGSQLVGLAGERVLLFETALGKSRELVKDPELLGGELHPLPDALLGLPHAARGAPGRVLPLSADKPVAPRPFEIDAALYSSVERGHLSVAGLGLYASEGSKLLPVRLPKGALRLRSLRGVPHAHTQRGDLLPILGQVATKSSNETVAYLEEHERDPLVRAIEDGVSWPGGDVLFADAVLRGNSLSAILVRVEAATGRVRSRAPLGSVTLPLLKRGSFFKEEPRCQVTLVKSGGALVGCDGGMLFALDEGLAVTSEKRLDPKARARVTAHGGALLETACEGPYQATSLCVRRPDGGFATLALPKLGGSIATLPLPTADGGVIVADYESSLAVTVRTLDARGSETKRVKTASRMRATKIQGDLDQDSTLTLMVHAASGGERQVEVITVAGDRAKSDVFPNGVAGHAQGPRALVLRGSELAFRDAPSLPWQRLPIRAGETTWARASALGLVVGDDVRVGWPIATAPAQSATRAAALLELECMPKPGAAAAALAGGSRQLAAGPVRLAFDARDKQATLRFLSREPEPRLEELSFRHSESLEQAELEALLVEGRDLVALLHTGEGALLVRRESGRVTTAKLEPKSASSPLSLGSDGSAAFVLSSRDEHALWLWPKAGAPKPLLTHVFPLDPRHVAPKSSGAVIYASGRGKIARTEVGWSKGQQALPELARFSSFEPSLSKSLRLSPCPAGATRLIELFADDGPTLRIKVDKEVWSSKELSVLLGETQSGPCLSRLTASRERPESRLSVWLGADAAWLEKDGALTRQSCKLR